MNILKDEEIHLKFLLGQSIYVDGIGELHSPLLKEIVSLTESVYNQSFSALLLSKDSLGMPEETKDRTDFQIISYIIQHDASIRDVFFCGLNLHFNKEPKVYFFVDEETEIEHMLVYFDELSAESILTEEKYEYIKRLVRIANNVTEDEKESYDAGNEQARKFIEKLKKKKAKMAEHKKPKINLHSIISAVAWKVQGFDFINQLNIYQLYDGYYRFNLLDDYKFTMGGIYAGTVDASKIKLEDINWANVVNTKK